MYTRLTNSPRVQVCVDYSLFEAQDLDSDKTEAIE